MHQPSEAARNITNGGNAVRDDKSFQVETDFICLERHLEARGVSVQDT